MLISGKDFYSRKIALNADEPSALLLLSLTKNVKRFLPKTVI